MNPAKPQGRRTHQNSKLASLRRDRREQRGPETEWLESRTAWGISVDLFRHSLEGGAEYHPTLRREPRTANVRITEGDAFEGRKLRRVQPPGNPARRQRCYRHQSNYGAEIRE